MASGTCAAYRAKTQANAPVEVTFGSSKPHADPFSELTFDAVFTDPDGKQFKVP